MNLTLIGNLIRLRYKLLWANTRTRNGKIALFFSGYLLFVLVFALLTAGGLGAGMIAVRSGKAGMVARVVLTSLFMQALITSVILGFGLSAVFSDLELRRYPIAARERFLVRHLIGIIDPFWFLILGLQLGLVVGLYVLGAAGFFQALAPVLLVFLANYLAARVLAMVVGRMMQTKSGGAAIMALILLIAVGGGASGRCPEEESVDGGRHCQGAAFHAAVRRRGGDDGLGITGSSRVRSDLRLAGGTGRGI